MNSSLKKRPKIFEFDNFRAFLKSYQEYKKEIDPNFTLRSFAKRAGFNSPATLTRIINGERNLSKKGIIQFSKAMDLNGQEIEFFENLVFFNQAKTEAQQEHFAKKILKSKLHKEIKPLAEDQYYYWSCWFNPIIRELVELPNFNENPQWIANQITPAISSKKASIALKKLLNLNLLKRNNNGNLEKSDANITTGDQVVFSPLKKFHRTMIQLGKESIERFDKKDRQVSSLTLSLNRTKFEKIKVLINQFRKDLLAIANEDEEDNQIFQINFQIFPVTKGPSEDSNSSES